MMWWKETSIPAVWEGSSVSRLLPAWSFRRERTVSQGRKVIDVLSELMAAVYIASVEEGTTKEDIERYAANFGTVMSSRVQACEKEATAALTGPNSIYKSNQQR